MTEHLDVFLSDVHIGTITPARRDRRQVTFAVDPSYSDSPSMLTEGFSLIPGTVADTRHASNFFGGYAPEGNHRIRLAARARIDESDLFAFMKHYGLTMAGALSIRTEEPKDHVPGKYRKLSTRDVIRKLEKVQHDFDLGNEPDSGRSMLPGFQPKLYDAVPILHINDDPSRIGSKKIGDELSLAIGGEFNHHKITLDHFRAEVAGWGGMSARRTESIIAETLEWFAAALEQTPSVPGGSPALRDRLGYNLDRISSDRAIGKPTMPINAWTQAG